MFTKSEKNILVKSEAYLADKNLCFSKEERKVNNFIITKFIITILKEANAGRDC